VSPAVRADPVRVVVIDDTADIRDLLRIGLGRAGMCVVGEAGDGQAGIEAVRIGRPDVILLDLSMPVMDGLEALPQIRALAPEARIVVLSGFGASELAERAVQSGADGYVQKGASLGRILDRIREIAADRLPDTAPEHHRTPNGRQEGLAAPRNAPVQSHPIAGVSDWWEALERAPFAILELHAEQPYWLYRLNAAAKSLLSSDSAHPGVPLHDLCPELAMAISENRLRGDSQFEVSVHDVPVQVSLRRHGSSLVLYLLLIGDEVAKLRSAIATTAHEIRGPVSVLCGVAETLAGFRDELDPAVQERMLASVRRQSVMLETITADLLTAAQIQRGTLRLELQTVNPPALIEALVQERYPGSVTVEVKDRRPVSADPLRLEQMIGNLLGNAHKYGRPPIVVRMRPCADHRELLCIDVEDNGVGVPPEFQEQLFREYSRASGTAAAGNGLGLHVVRTLVEAQGGAVSYAPGRNGGAVFTLTLQALTVAL